nr:trichohyalin isoform X4 [Crassostrea gigas]XP_034332050.1 trichohyalin isoform X4 [Crassostrea gigas]
MNEMEERVLTRRQRSFLREMEERTQASTKIQKEMEGRASVSLRKQKTIQRNIGEQASDSTRKQRSLRKEMRENELTHEGDQRAEVENHVTSGSTRKQRSLRKEMTETESTQEGAQRVEVENPVASVSTRTQRSSQREREEQVASVSTRKQRINKKEEESTQGGSQIFKIEDHASVSTRKQRHIQKEEESIQEGAKILNTENYAPVSSREQRALRRDIEKRVILHRSYTTPSPVSKGKGSILRRELIGREFTQEEKSGVQRDVEESHVSLNRSYTAPSLASTRKSRSAWKEIGGTESTQERAERPEPENHELTQEEILEVKRREEESHASESAPKQRTSHRKTKQRVCKDMKNKALPDQVEAETFQTKGCQYDYVENNTHSTKSMSFRYFVTPHKGVVLVIVNYSFPNKPLERGNDIEEIKQLFPKYGYDVHSFTDLNKEDILSKVKLFSENENLGSFVCFLSSHGNQTSLACPDGGVVRINDILCAANTEQLKNKPKVFFIDACRSSLNQEIKESDYPEPPSTEYYVGFSCLASKISLVGKNSCGIYFQALIEVFKDGFRRPPKEASKTRDINHFMAKVHHRVNKQKDKQGNNYQMPIFRSTLSGPLFLQGDVDVSDTLHNISMY